MKVFELSRNGFSAPLRHRIYYSTFPFQDFARSPPRTLPLLLAKAEQGQILPFQPHCLLHERPYLQLMYQLRANVSVKNVRWPL